jgi:signal transduction histidine kinase
MVGLSGTSGADRARRASALVTSSLDPRPQRPPDFAAESSALHWLAQALTSSDGAMLRTLSDTAALNLGFKNKARETVCSPFLRIPTRHAVTAMKSDVHTGQHELHITVPPYPVTLHADLIGLTQVVCNLLSNAVKYTPLGGDISLTVEAPDLSSEPLHRGSPSDAVITVKDNGSACARRPAEGGLRIGPAVVKHLVTARKETVTIASAVKARERK